MAYFCLPSLLWEGRLEWEPVCQLRRAVASRAGGG